MLSSWTPHRSPAGSTPRRARPGAPWPRRWNGSRGSLVERRQRGDPGAEVERSQCDLAQLEAAGGVSAWVVSSYDGDLVLVPTDRLDETSECCRRPATKSGGDRDIGQRVA